MKKLNLFLVLVVSIFLFNIDVKAETFEYNYEFTDNYFDVDNFSEFTIYINDNYEIITRLYDMLFEEYNDNYAEEYPYYVVDYFYRDGINADGSTGKHLELDLTFFKLQPYFKFFSASSSSALFVGDDIYIDNNNLSYSMRLDSAYSFKDKTYILPSIQSYVTTSGYIFNGSRFYENFYIDSNFDIKLVTEREEDSIIIHDYRNTGTDLILKNGDTFPTLFKNSNITNFNYTEINLNDYAYVALSLKDYNQEPFKSRFFVKGEYCVNAVYNYGMSSKEEYDLSITDICTPYYSDFTPVDLYILDSDIKNNAIYYLKAHDINKENIIKVDTSVFNIHYITEDKANNPIININGRDYSIIPFDELPSNSIKNTDDGNWPGASEEFKITDIFDKPLEAFKSITESFTGFAKLITSLFSFLPPEFLMFLQFAFFLAIAIGIIKIIL